jgi:bis(5'-nucleosyl)-tetraphosphatase (symmetrical)
MRWFVGDLQGCAQEFDDLLRAIRFDPQTDELWCLGDLVNRGPDSLAAVRLWRDVGGRGVIGNHDVYTLLVAAGRWPRKQDTIGPLLAAPDGPELLARLRAMPALQFLAAPPGSKGPDVWAVHAGLHPLWTDLHGAAARINGAPHDDAWLESPELAFVTRVRCCTASGERSKFDRRAEECPAPYRPWDEFYRGEPLVVHGHWAWRGHYRGPKTLGLDSGCVYGGPLTAWCQEEDRVVQVPSRKPRGA